MKTPLRSFLLPPVAFALTASSSVWAQGAVPWGCDAPAGRVCYFSIFNANGVMRSFSLNSGRKTTIGGVVVGRDEYLASIDAPNLGDLSRCRQLIVLGHQCQRKAVDSSYND